MGIFSNSSPFDQVVEKATLETNTKEDWAIILDICDRVGTTTAAPKECLRAIVRRLNHQDPHVVIQAILLLDACVSNCGLPFHLEIASREFEQEFRKLIQKSQERTVREKLLSCLQKWAENEFKSDPQLDLIPSLYSALKGKVEFPSESPNKSKKSGAHQQKTRDHQGATAAAPAGQQEDADLLKAIELSLKEAQTHPQGKSLYPQTSLGSGPSASEEKEARKVRALYDFEAAEENELTFYAGEIVFVTDDADPNWWHGSNQRGKGLFPANFVTADLSVEPTKFEPSTKKTVQFAEDVEVQSVETEPEIVEIDESKIDRVLHMLHEADPTGEVLDPPELAGLEDHVNQMGPLIDQELEKIDRRHAQLTRLGGELVEALNMYHNLMREPVGMMPSTMPYNMKAGMSVIGPAASMPHFPAASGMIPYQMMSYDPNLPYQNNGMPRPPHSAPAANSAAYSSIPYQPVQNGIPQSSSAGNHDPNPMNGSNNQPGSQHIPQHQQQPQLGQLPQQSMSMTSVSPGQTMSPAGQLPYNQQMMMAPHGHPFNMQAQGHPQSFNQPMPQMMVPPHMLGSPGGPPPSQYVSSPQPYQQPPAPTSANAPPV